MRSKFRAALVALGFTAVAGTVQAQTVKIGFVNAQALMEVAPGRAAADSALGKLQEQLRTGLQKLQDSIAKLATDYTKKEATLTAAQKDTKQKEIQGLETDLQAKNLQAQQQMSQKQQEFYAPVQEAVKKVIEDIRVEDGFIAIFPTDAVISFDKNLDVTDRMVARLRTVAANTKNKPAAANAPAGVVKPKPPAQ